MKYVWNSKLSPTVLFFRQLTVSYAFLFLRLTGFHLPPPVTSTKSVFSLRLTSDFAVSAHGFKVYYEGKTFLTKCSGFFSLISIHNKTICLTKMYTNTRL